ncbi:hypothetical protein BJF78_11470 [Pseudonocardia sp. CNS-139]|nr:hypothetical protein BJF78_11470 [Pseudonocardia sp. CNS-139]
MAAPRVRRSTTEPDGAGRRASHPKSRSRSRTRPGPSAVNRGSRSGSVSPSTSVAPGRTMPAFSRATSARVGPARSVWSSPTLVTTATDPSTTFVASQRPSMPTSTTATSTARCPSSQNAAAVSASNQLGVTPHRSAAARTSRSASATRPGGVGAPSTVIRSPTSSTCGLV